MKISHIMSILKFLTNFCAIRQSAKSKALFQILFAMLH